MPECIKKPLRLLQKVNTVNRNWPEKYACTNEVENNQGMKIGLKYNTFVTLKPIKKLMSYVARESFLIRIKRDISKTELSEAIQNVKRCDCTKSGIIASCTEAHHCFCKTDFTTRNKGNSRMFSFALQYPANMVVRHETASQSSWIRL